MLLASYTFCELRDCMVVNVETYVIWFFVLNLQSFPKESNGIQEYAVVSRSDLLGIRTNCDTVHFRRIVEDRVHFNVHLRVFPDHTGNRVASVCSQL